MSANKKLFFSLTMSTEYITVYITSRWHKVAALLGARHQIQTYMQLLWRNIRTPLTYKKKIRRILVMTKLRNQSSTYNISLRM